MSANVDLIIGELPRDDKEAWSKIEVMRGHYYEDNSGAHPDLKRLHDSLVGKYPCLSSYTDDDESIENCPWADGPMINNFASRMGMLAIQHSRINELGPFIVAEARKLNIIVADPQTGSIYRPQPKQELKPSTESKKWWQFWK